MSEEWNGVTDAHLTSDVVATSYIDGVLHVLLIKRREEPYAGCWALPGGYVDRGESFEQAARRELLEETSLCAPAELRQVGVYDAPDRDPRARVVSVAFAAYFEHALEPVARDDAAVARWVPVEGLSLLRLAFDHAEIVSDALVVVVR